MISLKKLLEAKIGKASNLFREDDQDGAALAQRSLPFDVFLNGKLIDTVWGLVDPSDIPNAEREMKRSLVNHDGYSSGIVVKLNRKSSKKENTIKEEFDKWTCMECHHTSPNRFKICPECGSHEVENLG